MHHRSVRSSWAVCLACLVSTASLALAGDALDYRVVKDWPSLPKTFTWGAVSGVAIDSQDHVWVFHRGTPPIVELDPSGKILRTWGENLLKNSHGLRIDREGYLWATDLEAHQVFKFDVTGKLLLALGTKGKPGLSGTQFDKPTDIAFGPQGEIFVSDGYGNSRIAKFSKDGKFLTSWGKRGKGPGEFHTPHAIQIDSHGTVYVGDRENDRVQTFDLNGKLLGQWTTCGAPYGLCLTNDRRMLLADGRAHLFRLLTLEGTTTGRWGASGKSPGQFALPHAIAEDSRGAVYVTEINNKRIQKFVPSQK